ncbi:MAG: hypothetical protein JRJ58_07840 [Deltaproteobacteria bacterium]|nr:hypothetical protein [Deltaproteobacteria bacterium]
MGSRANWTCRGSLLGAIAILGLWGLEPVAAAESGVEQSDGEQQAPQVEPDSMHIPGNPTPRGSPTDLDALLQLPSGYVGRPLRFVAGASQAEWKRRFVTGQESLSAARDALEATKLELDGIAEQGGGTQWSIAPPGGGGAASPTSSPLSFKLRQELKQNRLALADSEKALRKLEIEADLAGVPRSWRDESALAEVVPPELGQLLD